MNLVTFSGSGGFLASISLCLCCTELSLFCMKQDCVGDLKAAKTSTIRIHMPPNQGCFIVFVACLVGSGDLSLSQSKTCNFSSQWQISGETH